MFVISVHAIKIQIISKHSVRNNSVFPILEGNKDTGLNVNKQGHSSLRKKKIMTKYSKNIPESAVTISLVLFQYTSVWIRH